jgi:predicted small integral membrane protein
MSETAALLTALAMTACIMAVVAWVMLRRRKTPGLIALQPSRGRRIAAAALLSVAAVVGVWIGNRGDLSDPFAIAMALLCWGYVMFIALRRPKRS